MRPFLPPRVEEIDARGVADELERIVAREIAPVMDHGVGAERSMCWGEVPPRRTAHDMSPINFYMPSAAPDAVGGLVTIAGPVVVTGTTTLRLTPWCTSYEIGPLTEAQSHLWMTMLSIRRVVQLRRHGFEDADQAVLSAKALAHEHARQLGIGVDAFMPPASTDLWT